MLTALLRVEAELGRHKLLHETPGAIGQGGGKLVGIQPESLVTACAPCPKRDLSDPDENPEKNTYVA